MNNIVELHRPAFQLFEQGEWSRLEKARKAAHEEGCRLLRMARECDHAADSKFREARQIAEQMEVYRK